MTGSPSQIRVLLADDQELFREGLAKLLDSRLHGIKVVGQCDRGSEVVEKARETEPDVVLMDVCMPGGDGIEAAQRISASLPGTKVAMLTNAEEDENLFNALRAGARGYLLKNIRVDVLIKSIELIAQGDVVVSPPLSGKLLGGVASTRLQKEVKNTKSDSNLSERETDILKEVAKGATNREIAETLGVAENTVKVHMRNVLDKLQLRNKQQAAVYASQRGWVTEATGTQGKPH